VTALRWWALLWVALTGCVWTDVHGRASSVPAAKLPPFEDPNVKPVNGEDPKEQPEEAVVRVLRRARPERGAELYGEHCGRCHGVGGRGNGPEAGMATKAPGDLTRMKVDPIRIYRVIYDGGGNSGLDRAMPSFAGRLSSQQVADLVSYVVRFGVRPEGP
jgi:mono/diheme cytochrome c family protein